MTGSGGLTTDEKSAQAMACLLHHVKFGVRALGLRQIFSHNLRSLCGEEESISAVCRDISINRQQFSRYLNGKSLPNKENIERICEYFGIVESDLYNDDAPANRQRFRENGHGPGTRFMQILTAQSQARMPAGAYWVDFASQLFPTSIVRAVLFVRHEENCTTFRRLTGRAERRGSWWGRFRGCHEGIVVERRGTYFFSGINTIGVREPSLLVAKPASGHDFVLVGSATVMAVNGPTVMPVAISRANRSDSLLKIVRQARSFEINAPDIPTHILDLLSQQSHEMVASSPSAIGGQLINA